MKILDCTLHMENRDFILKRLGSYLEKILFAISKNKTTRMYNDKRITFYIESDHDLIRSKWEHREIGTIDWIDTFEKGSVFWDIGANVGIYSVYAGILGYDVYAFEPVFHNFSTLNRNIILNNIRDNVHVYCISLNNRFSIDNIYLESTRSGDSFSNFANCTNRQKGGYYHGSVGISGDDLCNYIPIPNYIKIDVDGNESIIIDGLKKVLKSDNLKSILIEGVDDLSEYGYKLIKKLDGRNFLYEKDLGD